MIRRVSFARGLHSPRGATTNPIDSGTRTERLLNCLLEIAHTFYRGAAPTVLFGTFSLVLSFLSLFYSPLREEEGCTFYATKYFFQKFPRGQ